MTGLPHSLTDSGSLTDQLSPGDDGISGSRLLAIGSFGLTLLSSVSSLIAYGMVPAQLRIHWSLGIGPYYGPEFAPAVVILSLFPAFIAGLAVSAYWLDTRLRQNEQFRAVRIYYVLAMVGTLGVLFLTHITVIVASI